MIDPSKANEAVKDAKSAENDNDAKSAATKAIQALMKYGTCVKECPKYNKDTPDDNAPP